MPDALRQPKDLSGWVELDYFERERSLRRWRRRLTLGVLVFVGLVVAASVVASVFARRTSRLYQARPLADAHAKFNDQCQSCHTAPFRTVQRFVPGLGNVHSVADSACQACHSNDVPAGAQWVGPRAPAHNSVSADPGCAGCHHEHRGWEAQLKRVDDRYCTVCHADLKAHDRQPEACRFRDVAGFPEGHPEFALHEGMRDPGQIKFNHKKHLVDLPANLRVAGQGDEQCARCHEPEADGHYMRPVNHEKHCQGCHAGQRKVQLAGRFLDAQLQEVFPRLSDDPVPHMPPEDVRDKLRGRLLGFLQTHRLEPASGLDLPAPWPKPKGELAWKLVTGPAGPSQSARFLPDQLEQMERQLFDRSSGCAYCHTPETGPSGKEIRTVDSLPSYRPSSMPSRWLPDARFDHGKHRMLDCAHCHDAANSSHTSDILMPKLATCAACHSPAGGVRFDCAECHNFHGRESQHADPHSFVFPPSRWK